MINFGSGFERVGASNGPRVATDPKPKKPNSLDAISVYRASLVRQFIYVRSTRRFASVSSILKVYPA